MKSIEHQQNDISQQNLKCIKWYEIHWIAWHIRSENLEMLQFVINFMNCSTEETVRLPNVVPYSVLWTWFILFLACAPIFSYDFPLFDFYFILFHFHFILSHEWHHLDCANFGWDHTHTHTNFKIFLSKIVFSTAFSL